MRWLEILVWVIYVSHNPDYFPCLSSNVTNTYAFVGTQLCPTFCDPMDCSLLGSYVHGVLQARVVKWVAMPSSSSSGWSGGNYWADGKWQTVVKEHLWQVMVVREWWQDGENVVLLEILICIASNSIVILSEVREGEIFYDTPLCAI